MTPLLWILVVVLLIAAIAGGCHHKSIPAPLDRRGDRNLHARLGAGDYLLVGRPHDRPDRQLRFPTSGSQAAA